jgi:hypothetical protein
MNINEIRVKHKRLISASNPEWQEIIELQKVVQHEFRQHECLSLSTLEKVLHWRIDNPSQIEKILASCPEFLLKSITDCYYKVNHPDDEMNTRIKVHVLLSLPWIGIGISSAIMALHEPKRYGTSDARSWEILFQQTKKSPSKRDYLRYLERAREVAAKAECTIFELDYILWNEYETL